MLTEYNPSKERNLKMEIDKLIATNKLPSYISDNLEIIRGFGNIAAHGMEELLPLVDDNTPANDKNAVELTVMSDIVIAYEKEHYPIEKPTVAELIELSLEEKGITQKQLASEIGISPSRVNDL